MKILVFLLFSISLLAQENDAKKVVWGLTFSPALYDRHLINNTESDQLDLVIDVRNEDDIALNGFSGGILSRIQLNSNLALNTGIKFTRRGYKTKWFITTPIPGFQTDFERARVKNFIHYLDIPLEIHFEKKLSKTSWIIGGGVQTSIFINGKTIVQADLKNGTKIRNTSDTMAKYKRLMFSGRIKSGLRMNSFGGFDIEVLPFFEYGLHQAIKTDIGQILYGFGLELNLLLAKN